MYNHFKLVFLLFTKKKKEKKFLHIDLIDLRIGHLDISFSF